MAKIQQELRKPVANTSFATKSTQTSLDFIVSATKRSTNLHQATCVAKKSKQWNPSTLLTEN